MTAANEIIKFIRLKALESERSLQVDIGPSELGGCRRKVWYRINRQFPTNYNTLVLSSMMGTAIHKYIDDAIWNKFHPRLETEIEVSHEGIRGHIDCYVPSEEEVIDWKTTKKANLSYFPSLQQRWQVQVYGWLLTQNGRPVKTVTLVAIPRDKEETDIVYHSEPYDEKIALEALAWLEEIKQSTEAPAPEKDATFCRNYCQFYDETGYEGCKGRGKETAPTEVLIEDELVSKAAREYLDLGLAIKQLEDKQEAIKEVLEGVNGMTPEGIKVKWSLVAGRQTVDEEEVQKALGFVPKKTGKESARLSVKE